MLELMRKHAKNWLMKVLLCLIIIVFVFYFGATRSQRQTETIAEICGTEITSAEFAKEYQNVMDFYKQRYGNGLDDELLKALRPRQQALNNLVNQAVILYKADELDLDVSDKELGSIIASYPAFQVKGVFSKDRYNQVLRRNRITPEDFENYQRQALKIDKLERLIKESVKISEREAYDIYRVQNEKINIDFIKINPADFRTNKTPSDENLDEYLKKHGEEFRVPQKAQVSYIAFLGKDFAGETEIAQEEIEEYYTAHAEEFKKGKDEKGRLVPETKKEIIARLSLEKGMETASKESKEANDVIYQEENFEQYAETNNLKITTTEFFSSDNPPKALSGIKDLEKHVFGSENDTTSPVLYDDQGYYILKVASLKPSYIPALKDIKKAVEKSYAESEALKSCRKKAEEILGRLKKGEEIEKVSASEKARLLETGFFLPNPNIPRIGLSTDIEKALLTISEKSPYPDDVSFVNGNYVIIRFKEREKPDEKDWEAKKAYFKEVLLNMKRERYFSLWIEETKASLIEKGKVKIFKEAEDL